MRVKPLALSMMLMIGLWFGNSGTVSFAAQEGPQNTELPRSFQGAHLGMTLSELIHIVPAAKRVSLGQRDRTHRTVVTPSKDRYVQRVEYRFYNDRLRELAIHYTSGEVPGGFERFAHDYRRPMGSPTWQTRPTMTSDPRSLL